MINLNNIKEKLKADKLSDKLKNFNFKKIGLVCKKFFHRLKERTRIFIVKVKGMNIEKIKNINKDTIKNNLDYLISGVVAVAIIAGSAVYIVNYSSNKIDRESSKYVITENKAEDYFYAGDYTSAVSEYINISKKDNGNPKWDVHIAEVYSVKGDYSNSRGYLQIAKNKITKDKIKDGELLNYLVFTEFMNKDYPVALKDGEDALKVAPKNKSLIKTMFTVYMANNQIDKAKNLINGYPVDSKSAYDMAEFARMHMVINDWQQGLQILKNAWLLDKDEVKVYDVLSQISVYNKDTLLEKVSDLSTKDPKEIAYKMWLTKIYSLSDDTADQATKLFDQIKNENVGKVEIKLMEVAILQNAKQNDKADKLMSETIQKNYSDYRVLHAAGWYYFNKKDYSRALLYCKQSIVKNKNYPDNYGFLMPDILQAQGKNLEGEPYFRTALSKEPYNYNIMLKIANYYWYTTQNSEKALEYFKFAEIVNPTDPEIKYNMACIQLTKKKEAEAIDLLKQCIKLDTATSKYHRTLGTIYLTEGKSDEGIKEIRYAYQADESDIQALNNAGCYYFSVDGDLDRGMKNFQAAYDGLRSNTDKYTSDTIKQNYSKAKNLYDKFKNSKGNESLKVPEFTLFY